MTQVVQTRLIAGILPPHPDMIAQPQEGIFHDAALHRRAVLIGEERRGSLARKIVFPAVLVIVGKHSEQMRTERDPPRLIKLRSADRERGLYQIDIRTCQVQSFADPKARTVQQQDLSAECDGFEF